MIINPLRLSLNPRGIRFELALRDISQNIYLTSIYTFKNIQNVFTSSSLFHNTHLTNLTDETAQYAAYKEATQRSHEVEWTNQIIGDAAAYAAPEGEPEDKNSANTLIYGFVSAWVYREIETRGLDFIDTGAAKEIGRKAAQTALAEKNGWELEN
ncbi:hypothetical protein FOXYSP1_18023 [Fusarium oxysporum f. sp. phaseoli]